MIEALGEVAFGPDGTMEISASPKADEQANLALSGLRLLTLVEYQSDRFICQLDTGADSTDLYEPFSRRHEADITKLGTPQMLKSTGVGGQREFPGYRLPQIDLMVAGWKFARSPTSTSSPSAHAPATKTTWRAISQRTYCVKPLLTG